MKQAAVGGLVGLVLIGCANAAEPASIDGAAIAAGELAYQKCFSCHSLEGPDPTTQGPSLKAVIGRAVAAEPDFAYSPALRAYGARQRTWTPEALDAFVRDPQAAAPGNEMGFFGIADPAERAALIAFLASR